jgi:hypothetical protein
MHIMTQPLEMLQILSLYQAQTQCRINQKPLHSGGNAEADRERLFGEIQVLAEEVALTSMPTWNGIRCKASFVAEFLEEGENDLAGTLARSLADDVLAMTTKLQASNE